jgi:mRNA interferase MazF
VLANAGRGDWILCQVTSNPYADGAAIILEAGDFQRGSLQVTSYARPGKLFTASGDLIERVAGVLQAQSLRKVITAVVTILGGSN